MHRVDVSNNQQFQIPVSIIYYIKFFFYVHIISNISDYKILEIKEKNHPMFDTINSHLLGVISLIIPLFVACLYPSY